MCVFLELVQLMTNAFGSWLNVFFFFFLFRRLTSPGGVTATQSLIRTIDIEHCSSEYVFCHLVSCGEKDVHG